MTHCSRIAITLACLSAGNLQASPGLAMVSPAHPALTDDLQYLTYGLIGSITLCILLLIIVLKMLRANRRLRNLMHEGQRAEDEIREMHAIERAEKKILALLTRDAPLEDILRAVCKRLERQLPDLHCAIALIEEGSGELHLAAAPLLGKQLDPTEPALYQRRLPSEPEDYLLQELGFSLAQRIQQHPAANQVLLHLTETTVVHDARNQALGIIFFFVQPDHTPASIDPELISRAQALTALAINRKRAQEKIHALAHFDSLTELPNRASLYQRLQPTLARARRGQQRVAICFLDLDGFKKVNDVYGHNAGDLVLVETARRLQALVRETDMLARLGGDEFVVVLEQLKASEDAARVAEQIVIALRQPFQIGADTIYLGTSIGIAVFPEDGLDWSTLLKHADAAMYEAKKNGGSYQYYQALVAEASPPAPGVET